MCLYPRLIINKKYRATKKNQGHVPTCNDVRVRYVPVGCGKCIECKKQKANEWRIRLHEELKVNKGYFVTLTFSPESLQKITNEYNITNINDVAGKALRLFIERIRKIYKKSIRHWFITELGQNNSERVHIHGIIFMPDITNEWLEKFWTYGRTDVGKFCNERTINYIVKYVLKTDIKHKNFVPQIFASKGLGKKYINDFSRNKHKFQGEHTKEYYTLNNGQKVNMPIYYRNKFFSEEEREKLWINKINKDTRYIMGIRFEGVNNNEKVREKFYKVLEEKQKDNIALGYGDESEEWKTKEYNVTLDMLKKI